MSRICVKAGKVSAAERIHQQIEKAPDAGFQQALIRIERHNPDFFTRHGAQHLPQTAGGQVLRNHKLRQIRDAQPGQSGVA